MDLVYILGWGFAILAPIVLFFMNNKTAERLDRLENENRVQFSNLSRLEQLYSALLAARHQSTAPGVPSLVAAVAAPPPTIAEPVTPPTPAAAEPPAPAESVAQPPPLAAPTPPPAAVAPIAEPVLPPPVPSAPATVPLPVRRPFNWERFLGVNLPIWLGAIALSLAGFFFVRYVIDAGLFTPLFRIVIGVLAAVVFLGAAEFIRRTRITNAPQIAAALAAAAIATLYACSYYASVEFALIPQAAGFAAMAGVTILAILIALVYGRIVAVVGLIGGYVAPALFASAEPSAPVLFGYLTVILAGIFVLIRLRDWWAIAIPALVGPLVWIMVWSQLPDAAAQAYWVAAFAVIVPLIVIAAASRLWLAGDAPLKLGDALGRPATPGAALVAAFGVAGLGLFILLAQADVTAPYWQGLAVLAALAVALGFYRPQALGFLQILPLGAAVLACLAWRDPADGAGWMIGVVALMLAAGAADQFRRLQRPVPWAGVLAFIAVFFFGFGMFRIAGWESVTANKHLWALAAVVFAAAMLALLWLFGRAIASEVQRNRVYAILGGAASAFLSLLVVIEFDPAYFPAAAALMILGLSVIHLRAPLRGLQVVAAVYLGIYVILVLGAWGELLAVPGSALSVLFATTVEDAPFALLVLPGLVLFAAATLFHRAGAQTIAGLLDVVALVIVAWGLPYLVEPNFGDELIIGAYVLAAKILNPELLLAAAAIAAGKLLRRQALYVAGMVFTGLVSLAVLAGSVAPVYVFWPALDLPGWGVFNIALLALGMPALILLGIGWFLRQDAVRPVANYGRVVSVFAVIVLFTLMLIEIRYLYHPDRLRGPTGEGEFYTYSIAMLAFGAALLVIGVAIRNRGARMLSFFFVLAATIKVFLWDAAGLEGLWRVLSFFGMGLSFLAISWLYARFVFGIGFGRKPEPAAGPQAARENAGGT